MVRLVCVTSLLYHPWALRLKELPKLKINFMAPVMLFLGESSVVSMTKAMAAGNL